MAALYPRQKEWKFGFLVTAGIGALVGALLVEVLRQVCRFIRMKRLIWARLQLVAQELVIRMPIVDYVNTKILGNEKDEIDEGKECPSTD